MGKLLISALLALNAASLALAHGYVSELVIDGKSWIGFSPYYDAPLANASHPQGPDRIGYSLYDNAPIYDPEGLNITCNFNPLPGKPKLIAPARAGSKMVLTWTPWPNNHVGATLTYLARCGAAGCRDPNLDIHSLKWFKIHQDGLRPDGTWFSEEFIANNSTLTVSLPRTIMDGEYLVRHEQLSIHAVGDPRYGAEFYPSCFQISVTGGGSAMPEGVLLPGAYKHDDPAFLFNHTTSTEKVYPFPGPPLFQDA